MKKSFRKIILITFFTFKVDTASICLTTDPHNAITQAENMVDHVDHSLSMFNRMSQKQTNKQKTKTKTNKQKQNKYKNKTNKQTKKMKQYSNGASLLLNGSVAFYIYSAT